MERAPADHESSVADAGAAAAVPVREGFDALYGLELIGPGTEEAGIMRGRVRVGPQLLDEEGRLHGGVPAAIAESLASYGTVYAIVERGSVVSGLSNDTTVTAPVEQGATLHAQATLQSRAHDLWVWSVKLRDDRGTVCAFSRVTIAVRPPRP